MTQLSINTTGIEQDIDYETARRAYLNISFSPEKRAKSEQAEYTQYLEDLAERILKAAKTEKEQEIVQSVFDEMRATFKKKWIDLLHAKSRCLSSMITGPANFPVNKARKANQAEGKKLTDLCDYMKKTDKIIRKKLDAVYTKTEKQDGELEALKKKLKGAETAQEFMKKANALYRKKDKEGLKALFIDLYGEKQGIKAYTAFWVPDCFNNIGFARYELSNNLANIKRMRERVAVLEKKQELRDTKKTEEFKFEGLVVVKNYEEDRLQLLFDDKPEADVRAELKSHGYRWAPSQGAWQRKLTGNAVYSFKNHLLKTEAMQQYQPQ